MRSAMWGRHSLERMWQRNFWRFSRVPSVVPSRPSQSSTSSRLMSDCASCSKMEQRVCRSSGSSSACTSSRTSSRDATPRILNMEASGTICLTKGSSTSTSQKPARGGVACSSSVLVDRSLSSWHDRHSA